MSESKQLLGDTKPRLKDVATRGALQVAGTAFVVLFCIVGLALWGLPFYCDFMVFGCVSTLGMFHLFYFFNALGYVCGGPLPNQVLLSRWFDRSRGKAMGFAYLGIGIGGASVPWISLALVDPFGWQAAARLLGLLIVMVSLPLAFLLKEAPAQLSAVSTRAGLAEVKGVFKSLPFFLLALGSMCSIAAVSGMQQNLRLFLSLERHYSQTSAAQILSLVLSCSLGGRLLMGWLADQFSKKYVMLWTYLLVAAGITYLFLGRTPFLIYASAAVFGVGLGGDYMIMMTAEIFGMRVLGRLLGVILTAGGVAEAVSPWLTGRLRDTTGDYSTSCSLLVGVPLLGAIAVLGLPAERNAA